MNCPIHGQVFGLNCYLCYDDSMDDLCRACGKRRGDHSAVSPFMDEHYCPEPNGPNRGFSATSIFIEIDGSRSAR